MATYVGKITLSGGEEMPVGSSLFGICETDSLTTEKYVDLPSFDEIVEGITVHVLFYYANEAKNPKLNVNNTGAFDIFSNEYILGANWSEGSLLSFTYHNKRWITNDYQEAVSSPYELTPNDISTTADAGISGNFSRGDHTHRILLSTGDNNGQVKIAGENVDVKGLKALAYKDEVTKEDIGLGNVENKSSETIRSEITQRNVLTALGYVPPRFDVPDYASLYAPLMDGEADRGTTERYAREDHVHPTDTSRVPITRKVNGKALSEDITITTDDLDALSKSDAGSPGGAVILNSQGLIDSNFLPSYVDDVLEYDSLQAFPLTGESGKIYIAKDTNKTYRWSGSGYAEISSSLALGETSTTAYRGDRGKAAYDHATDAEKIDISKSLALYKISSTSEGHIKTLEPVTKADITALGIPSEDNDTKYGLSILGNTISIVENGGASYIEIPEGHKYGLSISGHTVSLVENGTTTSVTVPDEDTDTKYGLSISGRTVSLVENGSDQSIVLPEASAGTKYGLSISGHTISLVEGGTTQSVTVPDEDTDTKYGLSISGRTVSLVENGSDQSIVLPEASAGTKYGLSISGHTVSLVEGGTTQSVTVPDEDTDTKYGLLISGHTITLVEGETNKTVTVPDNDTDTKYGLSISGHTISLVEGGTTSSVTVPDEDTDTKYGLSISGHVLSIVEGGTEQSILLPSDGGEGGGGSLTYGLAISGRTVSLVEGGLSNQITLPADTDTKYGISINGHTVSLVEGGSNVSVTIPDTDTTYSSTKETINSVSIGTGEEISGISKWTAGTPTSIAVSNGVLTVTDGTAPNLETSTKTIPNISTVQKQVVTDISAN